MKVYWTSEARARLLELQAYVARYSPRAARSLAARLLQRSRRLGIPPIAGRRLPEYRENDLREVLERPYRLIYRMKEDRVEVITIKHYRQRLPRDPKRLTEAPPDSAKPRPGSGVDHRILRVGLTGGIASGKSTVARLFAALGVPVIDTDVLSREVTAPGTALLARIAERFGAAFIRSDGSLDRRGLRRVVFGDAAARADLEALTHPAIFEALDQRSAAAGGPYQVHVLPLLVEKRDAARVDRVLVVDCEESLQILRLQARDGSTLEEARAMLAAQAPRAARLEAAHEVITNDSDLESLRRQVEHLHAKYRRLAAESQVAESQVQAST